MQKPSHIFAWVIAGLLVVVSGCGKPGVTKGGGGGGATQVELPTSPISNSPFESAETGDKERFVSMSPAKTGLIFENYWGPDDAPGMLNTSFVSSGVAVGDFDNDGLPDIFVTGRAVGGKLFKNLGGMKFKDVTAEQKVTFVDTWGTGATFADVNNDGLLDLYVCAYDSPNQLLINKGGHFEDETADYGLNFTGASVLMAFADYDCDGDLDAYLLTNRKYNIQPPPPSLLKPSKEKPDIPDEFKESITFVYDPAEDMWFPEPAGQFDHFYRNDDGQFVEITDEVGIGKYPGFGLSATWWDFDANGYPDLYVSNDYTGADLLYRNNGPGDDGNVTFTEISQTSLPHTPWYSMGSDAADLNNDGWFDLMASDMAGTNHYRDKLSMGAMSGPDSDAWFLNVPNPPQYMRNAVYVNTGTERFMEVAHMSGLASTDWTWSIRFADFDHDKLQDCYITNGMSRDFFNGDLKDQAREIMAKTNGSPMATQDFWKLQPLFKLENMAFKNKGNLKFEKVGMKWGLGHKGVSSGAATGDFDLDGDLDLIVCGFNEPLKMYRNDVSKGDSIKVQLVGRQSNRMGLGAHVKVDTADGDTLVSYAASNRGFMSSSEPVHHFGLGSDKVSKLTVTWPSGCIQTFDSLDSNQLYVVTEPESFETPSSNQSQSMMFAEMALEADKDLAVITEAPFDDFARQPLIPNKYSQLGPTQIWGDVNGDGKLDCFIGGSAGNAGRLLMDPAGAAEFVIPEAFKSDSAHEDMGAVFFDCDGDGDLDLYVVSGGVECEPGDEVLADRLYLNDGAGAFSKSENAIPDLRNSGGPVSVADFDRDGDLDIFVGGRIVPGQYPTRPDSILLVNDGGTFSDKTDDICKALKSKGMVTSCLWTDVDRDGWIDLLVGFEWDSVRIYRNESGKSLTDVTSGTELANHVGWFNSLQGGDIDNDGDTDYVVGNFGLNSKYKATTEKPEVLFYGDFEGNGVKHIVEAKYEGDKFLPRRGLGCTCDAMPMFKEKTETFDAFATSSLAELYTEEKLDDSIRLEANQLRSLVLINNSKDGEVAFEVKTLPVSIQSSVVFGTTLVDVNDDGNLDLYAVQNFYGPQRETGYVDGGVSSLLLGDGKGAFESVPSHESGLVVTGDARALSTVDLNADGRPDFVSTINGQAPKMFVNASSGQGNVIRFDVEPVKLIGARIELEMDGKKQTHEIYSTSGYLSQSSTDIFVGNASPKSAKVFWADGSEQSVDLEFKDFVCTISKSE